MTTSSSPLTHLAEQLLEHAEALDAYNASHNLSPASFSHESFVELPLDAETRRRTIIDLSQDVKRLAQGPREMLSELWDMVSAPPHPVTHHRHTM